MLTAVVAGAAEAVVPEAVVVAVVPAAVVPAVVVVPAVAVVVACCEWRRPKSRYRRPASCCPTRPSGRQPRAHRVSPLTIVSQQRRHSRARGR
jgi:hypothetical protein